jgi:hypothetical protein
VISAPRRRGSRPNRRQAQGNNGLSCRSCEMGAREVGDDGGRPARAAKWPAVITPKGASSGPLKLVRCRNALDRQTWQPAGELDPRVADRRQTSRPSKVRDRRNTGCHCGDRGGEMLHQRRRPQPTRERVALERSNQAAEHNPSDRNGLGSRATVAQPESIESF